MNESKLQAAVAQILDATGLLWCHVPNGGNRNAITGSRLKREGVKRGVPDILIFTRPPSSRYVGVAIELKTPSGVVKRDQHLWIEGLSKQGWATAVCRSVDDVLIVLSKLGYHKVMARGDD